MKSTPSQIINLLQSLAFPVIACALEIRFWDTLHPFAFLLFYPAVLFSGWLCGLKGGVAATALSVVLIAAFFMEPSSIIAPTKAISLNYGALAIFVCAGFLSAWLLQLQRKQKRLLAMQEELQQALEKANLAAERFTVLFERSPFGIALVDSRNGQVLEVNQRVADITGRTRQELAKINWMSITHPDDIQEDLALFARFNASEMPYFQRSKRYLQPDGSIVQANLTVVSVKVANGHPPQHLSIIQDMTPHLALQQNLAESQQQADELFKSHQQLQTLFDVADVGLAFTRDRKVYRCNHKLEVLLGYQPGELVGKPTRAWFSDDKTHQLIGEEIARSMASGKTYEFELDTLRKDGSTFKSRILVQPFDKQNLGLGNIGIFQDITQQWQANHKLTQQNHQLNRLAQQLSLAKEAAGLGIWVLDMASGQLEWDREMRKIYGVAPEYPDKGITYDFWKSFVHPEDWTEKEAIAKQRINQSGSLEEAQDKVYRIILSDGTIRYINSKASMENNAACQPARMIGINMDVTRYYEQQQALQAAKDLAETANQAKSSFLANMSHEIRTPMNAIINLTDLALDSELTAQQRDYLGHVQDASKNLLGIINDILDYSKIEAGYLHIESAPFCLADAIDSSANLFRGQIAQKGLEWSVAVAEEVPQLLLGDSLRLGQVLNNLIGNAVKFTAHGIIRLTVGRLPPPDPDDTTSIWLGFSVTDTGIGIAPELLPLLFQPFAQADGSITRRFGGTGLGLSIVRRLVGLMGGELTVTSQPDQGSTFAFTARFGRIDPHTPAPSVTVSESLQSLSALHHAEILLVEDNKLNQIAALGLLKKMQLNVTVASNGVEAISWVQKKRFAAVLMDMHMPVMGGLDASRHIRALPEGEKLPIIALTADVMGDVVESCKKAGMNGYLSKPMNAGQLAESLLKWAVPSQDCGGDGDGGQTVG